MGFINVQSAYVLERFLSLPTQLIFFGLAFVLNSRCDGFGLLLILAVELGSEVFNAFICFAIEPGRIVVRLFHDFVGFVFNRLDAINKVIRHCNPQVRLHLYLLPDRLINAKPILLPG